MSMVLGTGLGLILGFLIGIALRRDPFKRRQMRLEIAKREGYPANILQGTPDPLPTVIATDKKKRKISNAEENAILLDQKRDKVSRETI